ncbi:hypothetical protein [Planctopirus hydrillae]|uniref:SinR family protein n=1 Tax=Planctopirus hydrillae TaxID=1841610 RepID=A0A1C3EU12_9PLAN|nr:hypothetical protein [Planctopirus hydrillae]ODA36614.1 hypothetical protein A6X21_15890 [Planctopirus hydrillae]
MNTYLISYDMAGGGDYDALHEAIKAYGHWAHITESLFAVKSSLSAKEIRDDIWQYLPSGSRLIIVKSGTESAWSNVICTNEWLKKNL